MGKPSAVARARARELDAVILDIVERIAQQRWTRETVLEVAEREQVQPHRVEEWAAEARRWLRIAPDVEAYRNLNIARLDALAVNGEDDRVKVAAISEQNKMLGNHAPQKVEVRQAEQWQNMTDEQRLKLAEEKLAQWTEVVHTLRAKLATDASEGGTKYVLGDTGESNGR